MNVHTVYHVVCTCMRRRVVHENGHEFFPGMLHPQTVDIVIGMVSVNKARKALNKKKSYSKNTNHKT